MPSEFMVMASLQFFLLYSHMFEIQIQMYMYIFNKLCQFVIVYHFLFETKEQGVFLNSFTDTETLTKVYLGWLFRM